MISGTVRLVRDVACERTALLEDLDAKYARAPTSTRASPLTACGRIFLRYAPFCPRNAGAASIGAVSASKEE